MKHIIWDFNGTLLNDAQLSVDLDNYVFDGSACRASRWKITETT